MGLTLFSAIPPVWERNIPFLDSRFLMKLLSFIPRGSLLFPLRGELFSQPSRRPRSPRTLWSVTCSCGQASCESPRSRVTHSTHAPSSFVSAPVTFCTSLGSDYSLLFFFSVISSLFPLLSLPLTAQIALAMYLLLHEWGRELPFLTITLSTSSTSKIMLLPATA